MLSPLVSCLYFILFPIPYPFNQRSCLCFASQMRAENFPNHHFLSKTVGPSCNLRGAGIGAVRGSTRRCCGSAELLEQVETEAWSQQFTLVSNAVRIHSCVLTSFHNLMPTWEPSSGTASTEPPRQCKAFSSAHLAKPMQTQPLWAPKMWVRAHLFLQTPFPPFTSETFPSAYW